MFVKYFPILLFFIILFTNGLVFTDNNEKKLSSGPFKVIVTKVQDCETPSRPYMKNPTIKHSFTITNVSGVPMLMGTFNVSEDTKNLKFKIKGSAWDGNLWKTFYLINDIGCHSMLIYFLSQTYNIKYDRKMCTFFKGLYQLQNLNIDTLVHLYTSKLEYGRLLFKYELYNSHSGTFFCEELDTNNVPA